MTTRKYGSWISQSSADVNPGAPVGAGLDWGGGWVTAGLDQGRANDICWAYANVRHNILATPFCGAACPTGSSMVYRIPAKPPGSQGAFAFVPVTGRILFGEGQKLRCWWYCATTSEVAQNTVELEAKIESVGPTADSRYPVVSASTTVCSLDGGWKSVDLELPELDRPFGRGDLMLAMYAKVDAGRANYLDMISMSCYQPTPAATPTHKRLDAPGSIFGQEDAPRSTAAEHLLHDETQSVMGNRVPRSNILSHWYPVPHVVAGSSYGNAYELGRYKTVKRAGTSVVYCYACVNEDQLPGYLWDLRFSLTTSVEGTATVTSIGHAATSYWVGSKFTFSTADTLIEKELELGLAAQHRYPPGAYYSQCHVPGICVTEKPISTTSISHTIPDPSNGLEYKSWVLGSQQKAEADTLTSLWKHQPTICLSDFRVGSGGGHLDQIICAVDTPDKSDPQGPFYNQACSVIARGLVFPSYACSRIRVTLGVQRYRERVGGWIDWPTGLDPAAVVYGVWVQLSRSTVLATCDDQGPVRYQTVTGTTEETYLQGTVGNEFPMHGYQGNSNPRYTSRDYHSPALCGESGRRVTWISSPVSAGFWLTPSSTITAASLAQPLQIMVMGWTSHPSADWLAPIYVSVDELPLGESEFP